MAKVEIGSKIQTREGEWTITSVAEDGKSVTVELKHGGEIERGVFTVAYAPPDEIRPLSGRNGAAK